MIKKILFDEIGLSPDAPYTLGQWKEIASHTDTEVKGFFGDFRFLNNFWPAHITLDDEPYTTVENAYQAAKYEQGDRSYLQTCTPKEAIIFAREHPLSPLSLTLWNTKKVTVMRNLLEQKFNKEINPDLYSQLKETHTKYLEETNYWNDIFWGVHKTNRDDTGTGLNMLGKLLMEIRDSM
jgi:ribA/ribD-fused uncharacterized protein